MCKFLLDLAISIVIVSLLIIVTLLAGLLLYIDEVAFNCDRVSVCP